jgi:hypothetical protein
MRVKLLRRLRSLSWAPRYTIRVSYCVELDVWGVAVFWSKPWYFWFLKGLDSMHTFLVCVSLPSEDSVINALKSGSLVCIAQRELVRRIVSSLRG